MSLQLAEHYNSVVMQRNRLMMACAALCMISVLLGASNFVLIGKERVIVLPAEVHRSFWVASDSVSDSYLEQMSQFLVHLLLNVSPNTVALHSEQFLAQVSSQHFAALKTQLVAQQLEVERLGISTTFDTKNFKINGKKLIAEVEGELKTTLGNSPMPTQKKIYRLQFVREQGRLWIRSFEEFKDASP